MAEFELEIGHRYLNRDSSCSSRAAENLLKFADSEEPDDTRTFKDLAIHSFHNLNTFIRHLHELYRDWSRIRV